MVCNKHQNDVPKAPSSLNLDWIADSQVLKTRKWKKSFLVFRSHFKDEFIGLWIQRETYPILKMNFKICRTSDCKENVSQSLKKEPLLWD